MFKIGFIIHRLGFLDFLHDPKLTQLPHLIEHLFQRNFDTIFQKEVFKTEGGSNALYFMTTVKNINFKEFNSLVKKSDIYLLNKKFFAIEKNRVLEELYLYQYDIYRFFNEKILEELIGLPSSKSYLKKYFDFFKNLDFAYIKNFFDKHINPDNRFLYFFHDKKLKYIKFPPKSRLLPLPLIKIKNNFKIKNKVYIKKDKNAPQAISLGFLVDFNIKNLFLLFFWGKLTGDVYFPESFYHKINLEEGLTYWKESFVHYLPNKILNLSTFFSSNPAKIEKLFYKFIGSISSKNKKMETNFYLTKKRFLSFLSLKNINEAKFLSIILFLSYITSDKTILSNNYLKTIKAEIKQLTFDDFIFFVKRMQKNNELFIVEFS